MCLCHTGDVFVFIQYILDLTSALLTVVPTKSVSGGILCLQLLSKTLTCTFHLGICESIDHLCINPIHRIGLIHK